MTESKASNKTEKSFNARINNLLNEPMHNVNTYVNKGKIKKFNIKYNNEIIVVNYFKLTYKNNMHPTIMFNIKMKNNKMECSSLEYIVDKKEMYLSSLLYNVKEKPEELKICKENNNGSIFYLNLLFSIVKKFMIHSTYDVNKFTLYDAAHIPNKLNIIDFQENIMHNNLMLSVLQLYAKGRTFYEGYGFIPDCIGDINDNTDDYFEKLEILLRERKEFLEMQLTTLYDLVNETNELNGIKILSESIEKKLISIHINQIHNILNCLKRLKIFYEELIKNQFYKDLLPYEVHSLSSIYNDVIKLEKSNIAIANHYKDNVKSYCYLIVEILIFELFGNIYIYPITTEENHKRISEIYKKYDIERYESICSYLSKEKTEKKKDNTPIKKESTVKSFIKSMTSRVRFRGGNKIHRQTRIHKKHTKATKRARRN